MNPNADTLSLIRWPILDYTINQKFSGAIAAGVATRAIRNKLCDPSDHDSMVSAVSRAHYEPQIPQPMQSQVESHVSLFIMYVASTTSDISERIWLCIHMAMPPGPLELVMHAWCEFSHLHGVSLIIIMVAIAKDYWSMKTGYSTSRSLGVRHT